MTNEFLNTLQHTTVVGLELWRIAALFGIILAALAAGWLGRFFLGRAARNSRMEQRPIFAALLTALSRSTGAVALAVGLQLGLPLLTVGGAVEEVAATVTAVLLTLALGYVAYCMVDVADAWIAGLTSRDESRLDAMLAPIVRKSLRITIVTLVLLQIATVLSDKPLTSILAGLGVGGLAVALAAQETIKNFFGSIVILADKPFELGDRIVVDNFDGPVERVGFRSTRLRTLDGHVVTLPNGELANKIILNITRRPFIRRVLNVAIPYNTPPEKVQRALDIVREILADHEGMKPELPPRIVLNELASAALNILVIYWYHPPDYWRYMAFTQRFNLELLRRFNEEGIAFAFPTQTVYLAQAEPGGGAGPRPT
jgi:MscS family membrane protein